MKGGKGPVFLVELDRAEPATLHEQLERKIRDQVRNGLIGPGTRMPSSRELAAELGVSRGVVLEAYAQLTAEGYLTSHQGAPTRVARAASVERPPLPATSLVARHAYQFDPVVPDLSGFPLEGWLRSMRTAIREVPFDALGAGDPRGAPELRNELMSYLARVRGAAPEPEHTMICTGFTQAFAVLCRTLRDRGIERIAVEDPGWVGHRLIAERAGLQTVPIEVDEHGLDLARLGQTDCETVVLTPAHQFPTGVVLSSARRAELLEWAETADGLIVEDDYDSELRYDRDPVGALQGLAPERVCFIGSMSQRLAPAIRLGWMLSPSWLTGSLTYEKGAGDGATGIIEQLTLADFIARGELDRHLRRMRLRYRDRRAALTAAIEELLPEARISGIAAGLYALVVFASSVDEERLLSGAAARSVDVEGLGWHRAGGDGLGARPSTGLLLGFGNSSERAIRDGIARLADAYAEVCLDRRLPRFSAH